MEINGTEYDTTGLEDLFQLGTLKATGGDISVFHSNVVNYHTNESFKAFITDNAENKGVMVMVALTGLAGIKDLVKSSKASGLTKTERAPAAEKSWQGKAADILHTALYEHLSQWFTANSADLFEKCQVPTDCQTTSARDFIRFVGKGSWGSTIDKYDLANVPANPNATEIAPQPGQYSLALNFRVDECNAGRNKKAHEKAQKAAAAPAPANGAVDAQPAV